MRIKRIRIEFELRFIWFIFPINRFLLKRSNFEVLHDTNNWRSIFRLFVQHSNNDFSFILINFAIERRRRIVNDIDNRFNTSSAFKRMNFIIHLIKQNSKQKYISLFCKMCSLMRFKFKYLRCFVSVVFCLMSLCLDERIQLIFDSVCCEYIQFHSSIAHHTYLIWSQLKQKLVVQVQVVDSST